LTSTPNPPENQSIASLKGVGAQTLKKLERLGLRTLQDLLFHLPGRYEDRTRILPIASLRGGDHALIEGRVELAENLPSGRRSLVIRLSDGTGHVHLRFFHYTQDQRRQFEPGRLLRCYGEVRDGFYGREINHPDYRLIMDNEAGQPESTLTPVYPLTEGLHQKALRRLIAQALVMADRVRDWLPPGITPTKSDYSLAEALRLLHAPPAGTTEQAPSIQAARQRVIFEELLAHHLSLSQFRARMQTHRRPGLAHQSRKMSPSSKTVCPSL